MYVSEYNYICELVAVQLYYHILLPDAGRIQQAQLNDLTNAGNEITTTTTVKNLLIFDIIIE